jgi:serine O-acetyltransferase
MNLGSDFEADKRRYPERPFNQELSIWALAVYRFGRWNDARPAGLSRRFYDRLYWLLFRISQALTGISIPKGVEIGPGCRIWHFGGIIIHERVKIGANVTFRHGVTLGVLAGDGPVPVIEDDVEFGAYAQVLGGVRIGRGAKIGPLSLVLTDVPPGATVLGNPAREPLALLVSYKLELERRLADLLGLSAPADPSAVERRMRERGRSEQETAVVLALLDELVALARAPSGRVSVRALHTIVARGDGILAGLQRTPGAASALDAAG